MTKQQRTEELCRFLYEMIQQAPHDLGGEQRDFYLPRLRDSFTHATILFPREMTNAVAGPEIENQEPTPLSSISARKRTRRPLTK